MKKIIIAHIMFFAALAGFANECSPNCDCAVRAANAAELAEKLTFAVLGEVVTPNLKSYYPSKTGQPLTITSAIALTGGFTKRADMRDVKVRRTLADGKVEIFTVNVREILRSAEAKNFLILHGDVIYVKEDTL